MAVRLPKSIYVHLMKTGGWSVRDILSKIRLNIGEIGRDHDPASLLPLKSGERPFTFVFIRHPLMWYRSYWAYRMQGGWRVHNETKITGWQTYGSILDYECRSSDFTTWIKNVLNYMPEGFLSRIFRIYTESVDYIGRVESLQEDLCRALSLAREEFSPEIVQAFPKRNVTDAKFTSAATLPSDVAEKVLETESFIANKWNYNWIPPVILQATNQSICPREELKSSQNGHLLRFHMLDTASKTEDERRAIVSLTSNDFFYYRVGHDCRLMSFVFDGTVGKGSAGCEVFWDVREEQGILYLDIFSRTGLTCALQMEKAGIWRGRWTQFEKMEVELIKIT